MPAPLTRPPRSLASASARSASALPTRVRLSIVRLPSSRTARFSAYAPDFRYDRRRFPPDAAAFAPASGLGSGLLLLRHAASLTVRTMRKDSRRRGRIPSGDWARVSRPRGGRKRSGSLRNAYLDRWCATDFDFAPSSIGSFRDGIAATDQRFWVFYSVSWGVPVCAGILHESDFVTVLSVTPSARAIDAADMPRARRC